jgi:hypothetical protein
MWWMMLSALAAPTAEMFVDVPAARTTPVTASVAVTDLTTGIADSDGLQATGVAAFGAGATLVMSPREFTEVHFTVEVSGWGSRYIHDPVGLRAQTIEPRMLVGYHAATPGRIAAMGGVGGGVAVPMLLSNMVSTLATPGIHAYTSLGIGSRARVRLRGEVHASATLRLDNYHITTQLPEDELIWRYNPGSAALSFRLVGGFGKKPLPVGQMNKKRGVKSLKK